jgi:DNA-directed RNA polymerase subunit RPC12/RpoP
MTNKSTIVNVDVSRTKGLKCPHCGNEMFYQVAFLREVPAILSPTMKPEVVPAQAFQCTKCLKAYEWNVKLPDRKKTMQKIAESLPFVLGILRTLKSFLRK